MLYQYNARAPIYLGSKFKDYSKQGRMSGGAGYILSKEAVRRFVKIGIPHEYCKQESEAEDIEMGRCLEKLNVTAGSSRDSIGKGRMFPFTPENHLVTLKRGNYWYYTYTYDHVDVGENCCSERTISFHRIPPERMHAMDFLIYDLKPFGLTDDDKILPKKK